MKKIQEVHSPISRPIRMVQFGEGNFLRSFVDEMIDAANTAGVMDCGIAIVKPRPSGSLKKFRDQQNLYTVSLRGSVRGAPFVRNRVITAVQKVFGCREDYDEYMALSETEELEWIVSNTTEAGIVTDESDAPDAAPPVSFPAKLTQFLFRRYQRFAGDPDKGLVILPTELIERNGERLRECVCDLARRWGYERGFTEWIESACTFCSTLVDRIVSGFPEKDAGQIFEELGYRDDLLAVAEPFAFWAIEGGRDLADRFPLGKAGCAVVFTEDLRPYRERKVRILNGAHTAMVPAAFLMGHRIVRDAVRDPLIRRYLEEIVYGEIVPTVPLPKSEAAEFASQVFDRFDNPFLDHALLSISLNSVSKWRARLAGSFRDSFLARRELPPFLCFSFAALLAFYRTAEKGEEGWTGSCAEGRYPLSEDENVLAFFAENGGKETAEFVRCAAAVTSFWGEDLTAYPGFVEKVSDDLEKIRVSGMRNAVGSLFGQKIDA